MNQVEQDTMVMREGGLVEEIVLSGEKLKVKELSLKDRPKLFKILEDEWKAFATAHENETQKAAKRGLVGIIGEVIRTVLVLLFGERAKSHIGKAIEIMNGVRPGDLKAIELSTLQCNEGLTKRKLKKLFENSMASQVKDAMDKIFKINKIEEDVKNYLAAAQMMTGMAQGNHPGGAALETYPGATPRSSHSPGGPGNTSSARPSHISNSSRGDRTQTH